MSCSAIIQSGKRKGETCDTKLNNGICRYHKSINICDKKIDETNILSDQPDIMSPSISPIDDALYTIPEKAPLQKLIIEDNNVEEIQQSQSTDFFNTIFDMEIGGPRFDNLRYTDGGYSEIFDRNKLAFILINLNEIVQEYRPNARDALPLDKYYIASRPSEGNSGTIDVLYKQDKELVGRYNAVKSLSGQNMVREVRCTILKDYYCDMDIDNAHPVFTVWLCGKLDIPCPKMTEYVNNREAHLAHLMEANNQTRDWAKMIYLSINYGGKEKYMSAKKTEFLNEYFQESAAIKKAVSSKMTYFKKISDKKRIANGKDYNLDGAVLSHICGFIENQVLMVMVDHLTSKMGSDVMHKAILSFDGIMVPKDYFKTEYMAEIENYFTSVGIPLKLSEKPLKALDLTKFGFDDTIKYRWEPPAPPSISELIINDKYELNNKCEAIVEKAIKDTDMQKKPKLAFGAIIGKAIDDMIRLMPRSYIREDNGIFGYNIVSVDKLGAKKLAIMIKQLFAYVFNDSNHFIAMKCKRKIIFKDGPVDVLEYKRINIKDLKDTYITVTAGGYESKIRLEKLLLDCKKGIMYEDTDVIPYSPIKPIDDNGNTFNLFGQYQHKYDPNFEIDHSITDKWVNHIKIVLGGHDQILGDYLLNWFAHMLQFPERKTQTVPLIKGITRCGKNLPFNIFQRYVINPSLSVTCADIDKVFGRFNGMQQGKLLIVLDEALDRKDKATAQRMKNAITEETNQIEQKGKEVIEVQNFCNYAILTNNDFSSIIEKNDARYICIEANGEKKGDRAYFKDLVDTCANMEAGKHLFHWLLKRDLSNFYPDDIPETKYKKDLKVKQSCTVVRWMLSIYNKLSDNDEQDEQTYTHDELFRQYQEWCNRCGERNVLSSSTVGSIMVENGFPLIQKKITCPHSKKRISTRHRVLSIALLEEKMNQYITKRSKDSE